MDDALIDALLPFKSAWKNAYIGFRQSWHWNSAATAERALTELFFCKKISMLVQLPALSVTVTRLECVRRCISLTLNDLSPLLRSTDILEWATAASADGERRKLKLYQGSLRGGVIDLLDCLIRVSETWCATL